MTTVTLQSRSKSKLNLLLQIARELGIIAVKKKGRKINETMLLSEESLGEAWNSKEDERWDELYKK